MILLCAKECNITKLTVADFARKYPEFSQNFEIRLKVLHFNFRVDLCQERVIETEVQAGQTEVVEVPHATEAIINAQNTS